MIDSQITNDGMSRTIVAMQSRGFFIKIVSFGVSAIKGELSASRTDPNAMWYEGLISRASAIDPNTVEVVLEVPMNAVNEDQLAREVYIFGEDNNGDTFLLGLGHPKPERLYTPTASLRFDFQFKIQNLNIGAIYQYVNTQAQEISVHNNDVNAHPEIQSMIGKLGIYSQEILRKWRGQNIDQYGHVQKVDASVQHLDVVYLDETDGKYRRALNDNTTKAGAIGMYFSDTKTVALDGIVEYTHNLVPLSPLYLSTTLAGKLTTEYSTVMIGFALPENKIALRVQDLVKYGSIIGGGNGAGSFLPILGDYPPMEQVTDGIDFLGFDSEDQTIIFNFKLPDGYVSGRPLALVGGVAYCANEVSGNILISTSTALLKKGGHVLGTYDLIHNSSNGEIIVSDVQGKQNLIGNIDLTDSEGKIGGSLVEAGDILRITLLRKVSGESVPVNDTVLIPRTCFEPKKLLA